MSETIHAIACGVLATDLKRIAQRLGVRITTDFLPGGLHDRPHELRRRLQEAIDEASALARGERIVIGYGVCGLGSVGIHARNIPLVILKVNDCIAMFLGSDQAYREQFARYPGTYYVSAGWVEGKSQPQSPDGPIQCGPDCYRFSQLVAAHGQENAEAIRRFLTSWQRNYQRAALIDTGAEGKHRYAEMARDMAQAFGWKYEEIPGSGKLLEKLLAARHSTEEILLVPPHHVTAYDAVSKTLKAVPVWESGATAAGRQHTLVFEDSPSQPAMRSVRLGLGIDAGGTYTDVVLFDFSRDEVLQKAKAPTTKWDFTIGIQEALDQLDRERLVQVDLVTISTTLATNAIVEGRGQKVGLLIFPPYGLWQPSHIAYRPIAVLDGKLEIDGREIAPIDPEQVRAAAAEMVRCHQVSAFAVAGYASHANPAHELAAKRILQEETGFHVTCGHEVSEGLNYRVRAVTAALNASIIPCLESFLDDVQVSLRLRGIDAPQMVVKSDGSLVSLPVARQRPVETVLSGPAASVAGASYLAGLSDAVVVDMGGTTTDTARIRNGMVETCEQGATVGGWRTHVQALDMRTLGLGGDSLIALDKGELQIGPRRVAPVSWIFREGNDGQAALDWLEDHLDRYRGCTRPMELLSLNGHAESGDWTSQEGRILELLADRPRSLHELAHRLDARRWEFLELERLERLHAVQRCGLTPTDVLHASGCVSLWNGDAARRACSWFCQLLAMSREAFAERVVQRMVRCLAVELLKVQLAGRIDPEELDRSAPAEALVANWLDGGVDDLRVRVKLQRPVVGIGAPIHLFLPKAAKLLEAEAIIPPHADVANAIGAITSQVLVERHVEISPGDNGRYLLAGLPDARPFADFQEANCFALEELRRLVLQSAREAGTSQTRVEIRVHDRVAPTALGSPLFIGRRLSARVTGRPDVARLAAT